MSIMHENGFYNITTPKFCFHIIWTEGSCLSIWYWKKEYRKTVFDRDAAPQLSSSSITKIQPKEINHQ